MLRNPLESPHLIGSLIIVDKLCSVVYLDDIDSKPRLRLKAFKELPRFVGILFFYNLQDALSTVFIYRSNLIILLPIAGEANTFVWNIFDIHLHLMPGIVSVKTIVVCIAFSVNLCFSVTIVAYLPTHASETPGIFFAPAPDIDLCQAVNPIAFQHSLNEGQFFFCMLVRAVMRPTRL